MKVKIGAVIACKYKEFKNDKKAAHHPFLVINCDNNQFEILVCTDNSHKLEFPNSVTLDYSKCGLTKPTRVICSKYTIVNESDITCIIGNVTNSDFDCILNQIASNGKPEYFENWRQ